MCGPQFQLLWVAVLVSAAIGALGCSPDRGRPAVGRVGLTLVQPRSDTGVELHVLLPRDTISVGDRAPVEVLYYILNGPSKRVFDNAPDRYKFIVRDQAGALAGTRGGSAGTVAWGPQVKMVLPAGAWLGQAQDLRCVTDGGYSEIAPAKAPPCAGGYLLDKAGRYDVIVWYQGADERAPGDTIGHLLADTAVLVVRS